MEILRPAIEANYQFKKNSESKIKNIIFILLILLTLRGHNVIFILLGLSGSTMPLISSSGVNRSRAKFIAYFVGRVGLGSSNKSVPSGSV